MKARLHRTLINRMDLTKLSTLDPEQVHAEVSRLAGKRPGPGSHAVVGVERERLVNDVQHELFGLGPLEPLLQTRRSPTSSLTRTTRSTSSVAARSKRPTCDSKTTST